MKTDFESEIIKAMTDEKEIPANVHKAMDDAYENIRKQSKKKKPFGWKKVAAAACALIVTGVVLSNERVIANISEFFNFGDQGLELALDAGFAQDSNSSVTDSDVTLTLQKSFSDPIKIGLSFQIDFEDPSILEGDIEEISMDFRLKNGDGEYIEEFIPDTKPLKGYDKYQASGITMNNPLIDAKTGKAQFDVIIDSNRGMLPVLQDAVVEIESINIFRDHAGTLKKIDGEWNLAVPNKTDGNKMRTIAYTMDDPASNIQVTEAIAGPTSLHLEFTVDDVFEDETPFSNTMKIIDTEGNEYEAESFNIDMNNQQTFLKLNFPISSYNNAEKLSLVVDGIGEVELSRE